MLCVVQAVVSDSMHAYWLEGSGMVGGWGGTTVMKIDDLMVCRKEQSTVVYVITGVLLIN